MKKTTVLLYSETSPNDPNVENAAAKLQINYNIFTQTWQIIQMARQKSVVFVAIIGVSWFWFIGANDINLSNSRRQDNGS